MAGITIGELYRRITISNPTETADAFGGKAITWSTLATCWSEADPTIGQEGTEAEKITATGFMDFKIRYRTGIDQKSRITYNSEYYDIIEIKEVGRRRFLVLTGKKKV
jgi:SPP1 family predicted phage head-tail adaptor